MGESSSGRLSGRLNGIDEGLKGRASRSCRHWKLLVRPRARTKASSASYDGLNHIEIHWCEHEQFCLPVIRTLRSISSANTARRMSNGCLAMDSPSRVNKTLNNDKRQMNATKRNQHARIKKATSSKGLIQQPAQEEIRCRAYEIFLKRGGAPGRELDDWLTAEQELRDECPRNRKRLMP